MEVANVTDQLEPVKVENEEFLKVLFLSPERIRGALSPLHSSLITYGSQGQGKSQTAAWLVMKAREFYGPRNVNAVQSGDIQALLAEGLNRKLVNILIAEDMTLEKVDNETLKNFYKVRHLAEERGMKKGYIITILTLHSLHSVPKHLREFFSFLILCNQPVNRYDFNVMRSYLGEEVIGALERLTMKKHFDDSQKAYKAFWFLGKSGFIKTDLTNIKVKEINGWPSYSSDEPLRMSDREVRSLKIFKEFMDTPVGEEEDGCEWDMDTEG
jgi:hypothetical protein